MSAAERDLWAAGVAYEPFVGRWSRPIAGAILERLAVPPRAAWLDIGCGTGAVSDAILRTKDPVRVNAFDPSEGFIAYARQQVRDPRAAFGVADARSLPLVDATVEPCVSGLMLNFVPQPDVAITEMLRVVRPGGVVAAYVWDYRDGMQLLRRFWDSRNRTRPRRRRPGRRAPISGVRALHPDRVLILPDGVEDLWNDSYADLVSLA